MKKIPMIMRWMIILVLLFSFIPTGSAMASAPDTIGHYRVSIEPQSDGTLNMRYEFWNYCAVTDFPSADFFIGLPNRSFTITGAGGDIGGTNWVKGTRQDGVKAYVDFASLPKAGQCFNFWYEIHQEKMAYLDGDSVMFNYQPSWFDFATITKLEIRWKLPDDSSQVQSLKPEAAKQAGWAIWTYKNMNVDQKTDMLELFYLKTAFPDLPSDTPDRSEAPEEENAGFLGLSCWTWLIILVVLFFIIMLIAWWIEEGGGGGGYYGGGKGFFEYVADALESSGGGWGGSTGHSSGCAGCASCACACAGGGRAGCSVKGFKLPKKILDGVLRIVKTGGKTDG